MAPPTVCPALQKSPLAEERGQEYGYEPEVQFVVRGWICWLSPIWEFAIGRVPRLGAAAVADTRSWFVTDILFDESDTLVAVAPVLKVQGHDVILDSADRRTVNGPTFRRALVHDQRDGLTINFNGDYPGGVTISGKKLAVGGDIELRISHHDEVLLQGGNPPDEVVSLAEVIKTLRAEIQQLKSRLGG